ncbi:class I adenylate-forming enzyme family protein [Paraburkholderia humisilvae]|uniref:Long-chain-fatty-acid--CoA ligase n=1 Tax=Paraburkholderia humisilvae TaxID=627669 RepID=A0A6J5EDD0_9BURK|nr:class I adenylate-forming enzyme family protein [Paraburkholderia humisilvae]CAB3764499.1 Long-chain-fatty-acid--CoA ligase [Paraburkholderia humisilvae]
MASANPPVADLPWRTVAALLEHYRRETPRKDAIVDVERRASLSFEQLAKRVDGIARQLARHGVTRGARVVLANCEARDKLLLWLGTWRLGAVVCPLDVPFVGSAIALKLLDTLRPALVVCPADNGDTLCGMTDTPLARFAAHPQAAHHTDTDTRPDTDSTRDSLMTLDENPHDDAPLPDAASVCAAHDIASLCCTSGTTGIPKIVVYDHACYWLNGLDSIDLLGLTREDRMLEYRSFDWYSAQILSLMPFLQLGSTLCIARKFSRSQFGDWIRDNRITVSAGVPTVLNLLLEAPLNVSPDTFASLRAMTCSTAPLSPVQWKRFEKQYGIRILNLYGSSEAGWMCGSRLQRRKIGTVGYPAARIRFDIVDAGGLSCAPDIEGQVVVDGAKLALGVLQADGAMLPIRDAPLFTRDIAARDKEGFVRMSGRMDDLIIRGGVKIVPQEIEDALRAHPLVQDVAALGVPDPVYGQETVCFVVAQPGAAPDAQALRVHCRERLAREKVPKDVYVVASLPRSSRGKILRDALRQQWWQFVSARPDLSEPEFD